MGPIDLLNHVLNFVVPALSVALVVVLLARIYMPNRPAAPAWWAQAAINFVVNVVVLLVGLWFFERDGKMATYAALVLACASCQWVLLRGWEA